MEEIYIFILAIILHEIAHIIFDWIYTKRFPKISFKYLIAFDVACDENKYSIKMKIYNHAIGVLAGLIPILIFNVTSNLILIYIIVSGIDFVTIYALIQIPDKYKISMDTKIIDIPCDRCAKIKSSKTQAEQSSVS